MRFRLEMGLSLLVMMFVLTTLPLVEGKSGPRYPQCECGDHRCSGNLWLCSTDDCRCYHCVCSCGLLKTQCNETQCEDVPDDDCIDWPWNCDVLVVCDEEYVDWCNSNSYNYTQRMIDRIENAAGEFLDQSDINLTVVHVNNTFVSDYSGANYTAYLVEVQSDLNWPEEDYGADILVYFTADLSLGKAEGGVGNDAVVVSNHTENWALGGHVQHEVGHLFDCPDHDDDPAIDCVQDMMDLWWDEEHIRDWCDWEEAGDDNCIDIIEENADVVVNLHENR